LSNLSKSVHTGENSQVLTVLNKKSGLPLTRSAEVIKNVFNPLKKAPETTAAFKKFEVQIFFGSIKNIEMGETCPNRNTKRTIFIIRNLCPLHHVP
jgi:hypothetical protein